MAALAVHKNERLVRGETAKRRRADDVRAVIDGGLVEVEARHRRAEDLVQFNAAGFRKLFNGEHVNRNGRFEGCPVGCARAGHNDLALTQLVGTCFIALLS